MHTLKHFAVGLLLLIAVGGCTTPEDFSAYEKAITDFRTANTVTTGVAKEYILDLNAFERRYALDQVRRDPENQPIDFQRLLTDQFDPDAIAMRIEALNTIDRYTVMLASLASDEEQPDWQDASKKFLGSVRILETTARCVGQAECDKDGPDGTNDRLAQELLAEGGPLEQLLAIAIEDFINQKRLEALDQAVIEADPSIKRISALLQEDFGTVYRQRITTIDDGLFSLRQKYSLAKDSGQFDKVPSIADEVERELERRDARAAALSGLSAALDGFDRSHAALVTYATAEKGPQTLSELLAATAGYRAVAESLLQSLKARREAEAAAAAA